MFENFYKVYLEKKHYVYSILGIKIKVKRTFQEKYDIVSLGCNCLPRVYLTEGYLKPRKQSGELSCPFDLCCTPTPSLIPILSNNFKDYFDNIIYQKSEITCWKNKKYNILFNHDEDCNEYQKEKLEERFRNRISNFNKIITTSNFVYFVCNISNGTTAKTVLKLSNILSIKRKNKPYKLIILDFDNRLPYMNDDSIVVLKIKYPWEGTASDWWKADIRNTQETLTFKNIICKTVKSEIEKLFKVNVED